jgi:hypothetical protein
MLEIHALRRTTAELPGAREVYAKHYYDVHLTAHDGAGPTTGVHKAISSFVGRGEDREEVMFAQLGIDAATFRSEREFVSELS